MSEKKEISVRQAQPQKMFDSDETYSPLVDIYEQPDGLTVIEAELPGVNSDSIDIRVDKGVLTLAAEAEFSEPEPDEKYTVTYCGFSAGKYFRAFALSDEVDRDKIGAELKNGVLTLNLPRADAAKTRKIEIKEV